MEKIKKIIRDPSDAFYEDGSGHRCYMAPMSSRKSTVTLETQSISMRDVCLKIDELVDAVNELRESRGEK